LGVVAKEFTIFEILQAHQEATAYSLLKELQGYTIPFCYGVFSGERCGVALLLEEIKGKPLVDRLCEAFDISMQSIHDAGVAHCDISGDNILLPENGDAIFVDFENAW
jgi:serine/threonine protein kinase